MSDVPREMYIFGMITFYVVLSLLYIGVGNTLYKYNPENQLPDLEGTGINVVGAGENTNTLFGFVKTSWSGYSDNPSTSWINYFMLIILALIILMTIILLAHG